MPGLVHPKSNCSEVYVDIGAYGNPKSEKFSGPGTVSKIESFVLENHGYVHFRFMQFIGNYFPFQVMFDFP